MLKKCFLPIVLILFIYVAVTAYQAQATGNYIGSEACGQCHFYEYENFMAYSKKANSWKNVSVMASKLTDEELKECYQCHTTGYKQGGFISYEQTPELSDVGCETCHGPGREHADSGGFPDAIERLPIIEDCLDCHTEERNEAFGFRPLIYSGAH